MNADQVMGFALYVIYIIPVALGYPHGWFTLGEVQAALLMAIAIGVAHGLITDE